MSGERIELRGLRLLGRCGASDSERAVPQPLDVDVDVVADLAPAGHSDSLADTVDYGVLCDIVAAVVAGGPAALLERLAQGIADALLASDERIEAVVVTVRKLRPPVPHDLASAGVRLTRVR